MACEACTTKLYWFKRKKQCIDCLRYFCSECLIKRAEKMFCCDNCSMLSRRPLIRSQVAQLRTRDLRQYLIAKKVSIRGCVEKEELVTLLMEYANSGGNHSQRDRSPEHISERLSRHEPQPSSANATPLDHAEPTTMNNNQSSDHIISDSASNPASNTTSNGANEGAPNIELQSDTEEDSNRPVEESNNIEIEEIIGSDCNSPNNDPEPIVTEQEEVSCSNTSQQSKVCTEIPVWIGLVKLSDIKDVSDLDYLSVKQLKDLLSTNRVDFKGCVERCELLGRASRLWEEYKRTREGIAELDEADLCKICWDAPIECVILECGHMACCIICGKQMSECPICKQFVVRVVRFFKA
ncbi:E3 ubiquitin-protein ligase RNF34-like [Prorops nasuta]|uniref:E3 ubiquitin-protein ligase RNF34-like n=1 Tax=Prorops nasuta TaxID=863751 RepID=UPI0034D014E7